MPPFSNLPDDLGRFILSRLLRALPPPPDDSPETSRARDLLAMSNVARLGPVTTLEAEYAIQAVAAQTHAHDCLVAIGENREDFRRMAQCRAQSSLMLRQASLALREFRQLQAMRAQAEREEAALAEAAEDAVADPTPAPDSPAEAAPAPTRPPMHDPRPRPGQDPRVPEPGFRHRNWDSETRPLPYRPGNWSVPPFWTEYEP